MYQVKNLPYAMYLTGGVLALFSVFMLGNSSIADISAEIKSILFLVGSTTFLVSSVYTDNTDLKLLFYIMTPMTYLTGIYYTTGIFELSRSSIFLLTAASSVIIISLAYQQKERGFGLQKTELEYILAVLIILILGLLLIDMSGGRVDYSFYFDNETQLNSQGEAEIGSLISRNRFMFSRNFNPPQHKACIYTDDEMISTEVLHEESKLIPGDSAIQIDAHIDLPEDSEVASRNFSLERMDKCPQNSKVDQIVISRDNTSSN